MKTVGGFLIGLVVGALVFGWIITHKSPLVLLGIAGLAFVAGLLIGKGTAKPREMHLTGRVFEFPQGAVLLEVALKRLGSILPTKVTESE